MGKRKERRLAAKMVSNRRVKLDLVAEPSGGMVASSAHDEAGGDIDQDHHAVGSTSPSSSGGNCCLLGQRQENPLLLLGQYSDDELDEETSKRPKIDADGSSSDDLDVEEPTENLGDSVRDINGDNQQPDQVDTVENLGCTGTVNKENDYTCAAAEDNKAGLAKQANVPESSGTQVDGDLAGGWKLVMHEESNQYYYWNSVTGETSWEVPTALAEQTVSGVGGDVSHLDAHLTTESTTYAYESAVGALGGSHLISKDAGECQSVLEIKTENGDVAHMGCNTNQALSHYNGPIACMSYVDPSALSDYGSSLQTSAINTGQLTVSMAEGCVSNDEATDKHLRETNECYGTLDVHSSKLVKFSESLLHRMEVLDRSGSRLEGHKWITKEIEIRLSDCNALSSYGASLLPFWWHIEARLKQLESAVSKRETSLVIPAKHDGNLEATQKSFLGDRCSVLSVEPGSEMENEKGIPSTMKSRCHSPILDASRLQIEATSYIPDSKVVETERLPSASQQLSEQEQESLQDSNPNTVSVNLVREVDSCADEAIDMDVEMEVDEEPPSGQTASVDLCNTELPSLSEQLVQSNQSPPELPPLPPDEPIVLPPPDEEWIPPPPPDSEPVPPPPPEEPPVPSVPPPYPETMLCPPYPDQYGIGYTAPAYAYYPSTAEVAGGNYYAQAEGSYISEPQPPSYYEPVVTTAVHAVTVDVAPVEPVAYYDISSGTVSSGPVVSSVGSSGYYIESGPISYHGSVPSSDYSESVGFTMETGNNISLLPKVNPVPVASVIVAESQASVLQAAFVPSSSPSVGSVSGNGSTVDTLPATSSKNQTKAVVRRKKHTIAGAPSLRLNKKVSSLVDKWKAAKVELHSEEDEEPEDAYEVLGKKRMKEIEEWRARQIAGGEAQDNANFLPLGGDWRERVKRKKASAKTEAIQTPTKAVDSEKQQPDLVDLSKDLPPGWQAYWDESSKEIYYGNSITSETTWTRPTR